MAFDSHLAERVRRVLGDEPGVIEKRMFGGLAFMVRGHMSCGIVKDTLMVRVGPAQYSVALTRPHAHEMEFTGRPMTGMVTVEPPGLASEAELEEWVRLGVSYTSKLPPK